MRIQTIPRRSVAAATAILIQSCGGSSVTDGGTSSNPPPPTQPAVVATVAITPPSLSLKVGESGTLVAAAYSALGATIAGKTAAWTSAGSSIATVAAGVVTGVAPGTTLITATIDGKAAVVSVTVTASGRAPGVFSAISVGGGHTCALTLAGKAYCWGAGLNGQLGNGTRDLAQQAVAVSTNLTFSKLAAGAIHTCALTSAGTAYCWGSNSNGALGDGTTVDRLVPAPVNTPLTFVSLSAGNDRTCGLTAGGVAYCWGAAPAVGDAFDITRTIPTAVSGGLTFASISTGLHHTCGLATSGKAYCWGSIPNALVGLPSEFQGPVLVPTAVAGGVTFRSFGTGWAGGCGVATNDGLYCWGDLAPPFKTPATQAIAVPGGPVLSAVFIGTTSDHGCGLTAAGAAYCWGPNTAGQLGIGTQSASSTSPVAVTGGITFVLLSSGATHTCGLTKTGAAYCWGSAFDNQLGNGGGYNTSAPIPIPTPP